MKSLIPIFVFIAINISGCSKGSDDKITMPENGIAMKLGGVAMDFTTYSAAYSVDQNWHNLNIGGRDDVNTRLLSILVRSQGEIVPGEYVYTNWVPNHTAVVVLGDSGPAMAVGDYYNPQNMVTSNPIRITITSIGNNRVKGSFSGDLHKRDNVAKYISGNFNVEYTR